MLEERIVPTTLINEYNLGAQITALLNTTYSTVSPGWKHIEFQYTDYLNNSTYINNLIIPNNAQNFSFNIDNDPYNLKLCVEGQEFPTTPVLENWGSFLYIGTNHTGSQLSFNKTNIENIDIYANDNAGASIILQEPPVITDLSNTVWILKNNIIFDSIGTYNINFASNGRDFSHMSINNSSLAYDNTSVFFNFWRDGYKIIIIQDGEDATNPTFIEWLMRNATKTEVKVQISGNQSYSQSSLYTSIVQLKEVLTDPKKQLFPVFDRFRWGDGTESWGFNYSVYMPKNTTDNEVTFNISFISNNTNFKAIKLYRKSSTRPTNDIRAIYYITPEDEEVLACRAYTTIGHTGTGTAVTMYIRDWGTGYSNINITSEVYPDDFNTWLLDNAKPGAVNAISKASTTKNDAYKALGFDPYTTFFKILILQDME